jgi:hypothetical protein
MTGDNDHLHTTGTATLGQKYAGADLGRPKVIGVLSSAWACDYAGLALFGAGVLIPEAYAQLLWQAA